MYDKNNKILFALSFQRIMGEILQINSISTYEKKNAMDFNSAHIKRLMFSSVLNQRSWKLTTYEVWFYFTDERKVISPSASNPSDHPFPQKNLAHIACAECHQDSEGPTHQLSSSLATKKAKLPDISEKRLTGPCERNSSIGKQRALL